MKFIALDDYQGHTVRVRADLVESISGSVTSGLTVVRLTSGVMHEVRDSAEDIERQVDRVLGGD